MKNPASPITNTTNTRLSATFDVSDIIGLYKRQLNIDVSRFFINLKTIKLYKCLDTGYKFYQPQSLAGDGMFYENLHKALNENYYHSWKFENQLAFDNIQPGDKVLDIGCGIGNFLTRASEKSDHVYGLELNEDAVRICENKGLRVYNQLIEDHASTHESFYDFVVIFQVLEHITDVDLFVNASLKVLKPGGKILIGVPNNEPYFGGYDKFCTLNLPPHHMGLWSIKVFKKFSKLFNLTILKVKYDVKGRILAHTYLRAKYLAGVKSLPGNHSILDKIKIISASLISFPESLFTKWLFGLKGSHIAVLFKKN